jgi:hypothetical protein
VIVKCPSCGTRYRHDPSIVAECGRCSRCDERVPLVAAGRSYVLSLATPAGPEPMMAAAGQGIGIASSLPKADADRLTDVVTGELRTPDSPPKAAGDEEARPLDLLLESSSEAEARPPRRRPFREILVAILLAGLGVLPAYYLSLEQGLDPTTWMAVGGGIGLFLGWICIRWMRRSR